MQRVRIATADLEGAPEIRVARGAEHRQLAAAQRSGQPEILRVEQVLVKPRHQLHGRRIVNSPQRRAHRARAELGG
jgi:hypothetical protein